MNARNLALMIGENSKTLDDAKAVDLFLGQRKLGTLRFVDQVVGFRWLPAVKLKGLPIRVEDACTFVRGEGGTWLASC